MGSRTVAPKSRSGKFGFLDPDDPDAESVIRDYARETGQDPDQVMREELASRQSRGKSRNLDEVLAAERARAAKTAPAGGAQGPKAGTSSGKPGGVKATGGRRPGLPFKSKAPAGKVSPSLTPPRHWSVADGSGFLLGVFLYAIGLNIIRYGPAGARAWMAAKFLNRTTDLAPDGVMKPLPRRKIGGGFSVPNSMPPGATRRTS